MRAIPHVVSALMAPTAWFRWRARRVPSVVSMGPRSLAVEAAARLPFWPMRQLAMRFEPSHASTAPRPATTRTSSKARLLVRLALVRFDSIPHDHDDE